MESSIRLTDQATGFLKEAKRWTYFLSILGFIGTGLMLFAGIMMTILFSVIDVFNELPDAPPFPMGFIGILYIALAVIYFFPAYYLYKFSVETEKALLSADEVQLASAFRFLKKHFKFIGIAAILLIGLYVLVIIIAVAVGVASMSSGNTSFV